MGTHLPSLRCPEVGNSVLHERECT
jgi:hypothetical protein